MYRYLRELFIYLRVPSETPYGFKFIGTKKMVSGRFEPDVTALIIEEVKRGARTFIDVGAHHGFFTILASHYGLATYSFEPDPLNYRVLKRNVRVSHSKTSKINNIGLSNFNDRVTFFGFATGVSRNSNWAGSNSRRKFVVEVSTLDKSISLENLQEPILVKVDVEGYEYTVLSGLTQKANDICFEWHEEEKDSLYKILNHLQSIGYTQFGVIGWFVEGDVFPKATFSDKGDPYLEYPKEFYTLDELELDKLIQPERRVNYGMFFAR